MLKRLLDYWYSLEFFQPSWPVQENEDTNLLNKPFPWAVENPDASDQISFDIYLGKAIAHDLIVWALNRLELLVEDSPIERGQSKVCICAWKVDEDGIYVSESFAVSHFVWALCMMVQADNFNLKLNVDDLKHFQKRFDADLCERDRPFSLHEIQDIFKQVYSELGLPDTIFTSSIWAHRKCQRKKKDGTLSQPDTATELMSSYYLRDIAHVQKNPGHQVKRYVQALCNTPPKRISIDTDTHAMQQWLEAKNFPKRKLRNHPHLPRERGR